MNEAWLRAAEAQVLRVMLEDPDRSYYGYDLMQATRQASGTLYPALSSLSTEGFLICGREPLEEAVGRPPRVNYRLDPASVEDAHLRVVARDVES